MASYTIDQPVKTPYGEGTYKGEHTTELGGTRYLYVVVGEHNYCLQARDIRPSDTPAPTTEPASRDMSIATQDAKITPRVERTWTIAYRKPTGPVFHRVTNWSGTWAEAREMAGAFGELNPTLQVYYVPTVEAELAQADELATRVAAGQIWQERADDYLADHGNILVDSGRRVKIRDNGTLPDELLDAEINKVATEMNAFSRARDTRSWSDSPRECREWIRQVRQLSPETFAQMVATARTADERFQAGAE